LLKSADLVEKVGSGVERIRKAMKEASLPPPEFLFTEFFTVVLKRPGKSKMITSEKTSEKILALITENPKISAKELAIRIGISSRAIELQIAALRKQNKIHRIGPDKGGQWEVK